MVDTRTNQPVALPMKHRWPCVIAVAFSPDGRRIATASCERGFQEGGGTSATCQIWDAGTSRPLTQLLPHINWPSALAFRPDGRVLATGDYSGAVHLWDVETGASLGPMLSAPSIVFSLAFSPDGKTLAVGTAERVHQVELWDLAAGKPRGEPIRFKHFVIALAFPAPTELAWPQVRPTAPSAWSTLPRVQSSASRYATPIASAASRSVPMAGCFSPSTPVRRERRRRDCGTRAAASPHPPYWLT